MSARVYSRRPDTVWRIGPDRVLVHPVGALPESEVKELLGPVALVWLALDEPCTVDELAERLGEAGLEHKELEVDLGRLIDAGLVHLVSS